MERKYKWESPTQWLIEKASEWNSSELFQEFIVLVERLDNDTIQDLYQSDMVKDGYFESE